MTTTEGRRAANGASPAHVVAFAAAGVPYDDPMSRVLGLDAKTSGLAAWFGFTSGSTALMVAFALFASYLAWVQAHRPRPPAAVPAEIDILRDEPPPPPPEPVKEEEKPAPPPPVHVAAPKEAPPPPPAPAQAAKVLTAEPDPKEPVDLTDTIVQGNADSYAGGITASNGTSTTAVHALAAATGVPGGTGPVTAPPPPPPGPDLSRPPSVAGGTQWNAPFPAEADTAQIDDADVLIQVSVRPDGTASDVRVLRDPGNGFGREARRYAFTKRYNTALDHDGHPVAGTFRINVHFSR